MSDEMQKFDDAPLVDFYLQHRLQDIIAHKPAEVRDNFRSILRCHSFTLNHRNADIAVVTNLATNARHAHVFNVASCRSTWACPHCTPYVLRKYALKARAVIVKRAEEGRFAFMVTCTVPHYRHQSLAEVYDILRTTYTKSTNRHFKAYKTKMLGKSEMIKSTEVTYTSINGWHPHFHIVIFCDADKWDNIPAVIERWNEYWKTAVMQAYEKYGISTEEFNKHFYRGRYEGYNSVYLSVNKDGSTRRAADADYIMGYGYKATNLDEANSLATEAIKVDNAFTNRAFKSANMFDLLASDNPADHDLFLEYATVTRGKLRVVFTRNLLDGIAFEDDTDLLSKKKLEVICSFTSSDWSKIVEAERDKHVAYRANILELARKYKRISAIARYCYYAGLPAPIICINKYKLRPMTIQLDRTVIEPRAA